MLERFEQPCGQTEDMLVASLAVNITRMRVAGIIGFIFFLLAPVTAMTYLFDMGVFAVYGSLVFLIIAVFMLFVRTRSQQEYSDVYWSMVVGTFNTRLGNLECAFETLIGAMVENNDSNIHCGDKGCLH